MSENGTIVVRFVRSPVIGVSSPKRLYCRFDFGLIIKSPVKLAT